MPDKKKTVGIIARHLDGSLFGGIMTGIIKVLQQQDIRVLAIRTMHSKEFPEYNDTLALDLVDGWIVVNDEVGDAFLKSVHQKQIPLVSVNRVIHEIPCASVIADNEGGMYLNTEHLIRHRHRRIAFIGDMNNPNMLLRLRGYKKALADYGIPFDPSIVADANIHQYDGGVHAAKILLDRIDQFTAVAAATDMNALGLIDRFKEAGIRVPEDVAVCGYNNMPLAKQFHITTVQQPAIEMGERAAEIMLRKLAGEPMRSEVVSLGSPLVTRKSCGCLGDAPSPQARYDEEDFDTLLDYIDNYREMNTRLIRFQKLGVKQLCTLISMNAACLAYWRNDGNGKRCLTVEQHYNKWDEPEMFPRDAILAEQFPPAPYFNGTNDGFDMITLNLIRTKNRDWGVLMYAGHYSDSAIRNRLNTKMITFLSHTLASVLEHEELSKEIHLQNDRYRMIAEQLSTITGATSDGIWVWDVVSDKIEWYNDRIHRTLGLSGSAAIMTFSALLGLVHPDDLSYTQFMFKANLQNKFPFHIEFRMKRSDGEYLWVYSTGKMMTDDQDGNSKMVVSFRDVTESRKAQEQIMYLAYHDVLTGLPNRLSFNEKLNEALLRAGRNHHKLALLLFDLDRFKLINDSYGHQMGDQLLVQVANRLREHFEQDVSIFRFGGDEFLVLLPFISNAKEAAEAGQQIISLIQPAFTIDRYVFHMSCSIGISLYPDYGNDMTTLIKHADIAMYRAKTKGKNSWELFQDEMAAYTMEQLHLESGLRKALEQQEFELYYQPQVEVDSGRLLGVEALIRWNCPDRGIVSPGVFIPLAEETGLIHPIGSWVLREACGQIKAWQDAGKAPIKCSINISGKQFEQSGFFEQLTWILNETGADPGALCFEITETVAIHNIDYCIELFGELQELGISISLDDFGTGFSSIALLKKLPFQYVKIDPAFIRNILTAPSDSAIVQGIIMLAHSLGMKVVAEGVEEEGQLELLRQFGCDYFQGYYYCKPLPASQFEDSLERQN